MANTICAVSVLVLLLGVNGHLSALLCDYETWSLATLECRAFGDKWNAISPSVDTENADVDTTVMETFNKFPWQSIRSIVMKDAKLVDVHEDLFINATTLKELDLTGNEEISFARNTKACIHLQSLRTLRLSGTRPQNLDILRCLDNLRVLHLSNAGIFVNKSSIHNYYWALFKNLIILDLSRNIFLDLTLLKIGGKLRSLNISHTEVKIGDDFLMDAGSLKTLIMSHSGIQKISQLTFQHTNISYLDLSFNSINSSDKDFIKQLKEVLHLNLSHNILEDLHSNPLPLFILETLDLSHNLINLVHSQVFENLSKLYLLNLSNNRLTFINSNLFSKLTNLRQLDLSNNLIIQFRSPHFRDLVKLESLNLRGNKLKELRSDVFRSNTLLRFISIADNNQIVLYNQTFTHLSHLKTLDLSRNFLTHIPDDILRKGNVSNLIISCNKLSYLNLKFFESTGDGHNNRKVFLHGNPWSCGCLTAMLEKLKPNQYGRDYLLDGMHPSCYVGEGFPDNECRNEPLSKDDHLIWQEAVTASGIQC